MYSNSTSKSFSSLSFTHEMENDHKIVEEKAHSASNMESHDTASDVPGPGELSPDKCPCPSDIWQQHPSKN
jgi:hypothetical protein